MANSRKIFREKHYMELLGDGIKPQRIKTKYSFRDLDVQKPGTRKMYEIKTAREHYSRSGKLPNSERILKDGWLVDNGYEITWVLEKGGSPQLLEALKNAGIKVIIGIPNKIN